MKSFFAALLAATTLAIRLQELTSDETAAAALALAGEPSSEDTAAAALRLAGEPSSADTAAAALRLAGDAGTAAELLNGDGSSTIAITDRNDPLFGTDPRDWDKMPLSSPTAGAEPGYVMPTNMPTHMEPMAAEPPATALAQLLEPTAEETAAAALALAGAGEPSSEDTAAAALRLAGEPSSADTAAAALRLAGDAGTAAELLNGDGSSTIAITDRNDPLFGTDPRDWDKMPLSSPTAGAEPGYVMPTNMPTHMEPMAAEPPATAQ